MGATRSFRAGRKAKVETLKEQNRRLIKEAGYYRGLALAAAAVAEAAKMERPPDLEDWIESVLPDMDENERAAWDSQTPEEREAFIDSLGAQINRTKAAVEASVPGDH